MYRGCLTGRPYLRDARETQLSPSVLSLCIPVMCRAHALFRGMLSCEIPTKTSSVFNSLSLHTLSLYHTTFTIKFHNKYRVQKIEYNYNQIWHEIKANKQHLYKSQLYILQHARCRYIYTSIFYVDSRYTYCSHSEACFGDTTYSSSSAS